MLVAKVIFLSLPRTLLFRSIPGFILLAVSVKQFYCCAVSEVKLFISFQVANLVTLQGEDQPFVRNVMTLNSCSPIVGVDVLSFDTETDMLLAWKV